MADGAEAGAPKGIAALPPTTVRQIGSHQLLTDPCSVVKELIDNALDARAKSIFIDITANTIDSMQVKDDGHGIPNEDRALACRRYCTSKIRDFHDLKEVGGKWLGFRSEALASIADMSGTISVTTRVEGEPVAVKLTYQRNGELTNTERDSHPIGTTVKVTKLLEMTTVRKTLAIKGAAKCLAKIRRLMQAYALARPAVRLRLHVLKAKNNKSDFVYAPKASANVEDAALKIIGKECALQCDWTALELDGFELHAFLPKPTAVGSRITNHGAFISVDSRPVSSARGTLKKIAVAVRDKLRKANPTLANVKDLFFCLNIICPDGTYDPNVEPAKDDVIFGDESFILTMVDRLLVCYYPESSNTADPAEVFEDVAVPQPDQINENMRALLQPTAPFSVSEDIALETSELPSPVALSQLLRWRSSMYGIDEEDLESLQKNPPDAVEEEDCRRDVSISNPWTMARMNAPVKPRTYISNGQLPSPAKSQGDMTTASQSPTRGISMQQTREIEPLTPLSSSQANIVSGQLDDELQQSIQRLPGPTSPVLSDIGHGSAQKTNRDVDLPSFDERMSPEFMPAAPHLSIPESSSISLGSARRKPQSGRLFKTKPYVPPSSQTDDTWFGQPMRLGLETARPQKRPRRQAEAYFPIDDTFRSQRSLVLPAAERLVEARLASDNNTDIRDFFGSRRAPGDTSSISRARDSQHQHNADQPQMYAEREDLETSSPCRPRSADSYQRSTNTAQEMHALFQTHQNKRSPRNPSGPLHHRRRTKSSSLPLNSIPGLNLHHLVLPMTTSIAAITQQARVLDMRANTLAWGYDSTDAFDAFKAAVGARTVGMWVGRMEGLMGGLFERRDGVEVGRVMQEGVQRFLDLRRAEGDLGAGLEDEMLMDL